MPVQPTIENATKISSRPLKVWPSHVSRKRSRERNNEQRIGKGVDDIGKAHQQIVDAPAGEAGDQPERDADQQDHDLRDKAHDQRHARAVDQLREDIAPDRVGAKQVLAASRRDSDCCSAPRPAGASCYSSCLLEPGYRERSMARRSPPA